MKMSTKLISTYLGVGRVPLALIGAIDNVFSSDEIASLDGVKR